MTLLFAFEQVVWASENTTALPSPYYHRLRGNDKRLPATLTTWKAVDLVYERMFPYDPARQPHPPAGCTVLHVSSRRSNTHNTDTKVLMTPVILMLRCQERIKLLRSSRWVSNRKQQQHLHGYLLLNLPEMGITDVHAHIVAVTSSLFNPAVLAMKHSLTRPVMGLFVRHTMNVRQYTFKDTLTGKLEKIKATPNHPFYVVNQQRYIPVSRLSSYDKMINMQGHPVALVCPTGKSIHCGQPYHPGQVIRVYNLEVYGQHRYFVGEPGIMVHNGYTCTYCKREFERAADMKRHLPVHTGERAYACEMCGKAFQRQDHLKRHMKIHFREEISLECNVCNKKFTSTGGLKKHFSSDKHIENIAKALNAPDDALPEASGYSAGSEPVRERSRSPLGFNIPSEEDLIPFIRVQPLPSVTPFPFMPSIDLRSLPRSDNSASIWLPALDPSDS